MFGLGTQELIIILVIALLIFGPSRLAGIGGAMGKAIREFRGAVKDAEDEAGDKAEKTHKA